MTQTAPRIRMHVTCSQCWRQWAYDIPVATNVALFLANEGWWPEQQLCPGCFAPH